VSLANPRRKSQPWGNKLGNGELRERGRQGDKERGRQRKIIDD